MLALPRQFWNRIPQAVREQVVKAALEHPEKSPRELAWFLTDFKELPTRQPPNGSGSPDYR